MLDQMLERGEDIYETAVSIGIQNESELTIQRWLQGDITMRVEGAYGDGIITKFATALNVNTSTLKQRRTISKFYESDTRYLFDDTVGYSHYREAMRLFHIDDAIEALRHASENELPVWIFKDYINKRLGVEKQELESAEGIIWKTYELDGREYVTVQLEVGAKLSANQFVSIKVKR